MATIEYIQRKIKPVYVDGVKTGATETVDIFGSRTVPDEEVAATITDLEAKGFVSVRCPHRYAGTVDRSERHTSYDDPARIRRAD